MEGRRRAHLGVAHVGRRIVELTIVGLGAAGEIGAEGGGGVVHFGVVGGREGKRGRGRGGKGRAEEGGREWA